MASAEMARPNARRFRSMLFAPGNNAKFIPKVFDSGADAVILGRHGVVLPRHHRHRGTVAGWHHPAKNRICIHTEERGLGTDSARG